MGTHRRRPKRGPANARHQEFDLRIDKLVSGGDGLGRYEGRVVFVPETVPGEIHRVQPLVVKRDFVRGRSLGVVGEASAERREAPCPHCGECGGCALMHLDPQAQSQIKRDVLFDVLQRLGKLRDVGEVEMITGPELGYRSRIRFHFPSSQERRRPFKLGFRARRSHRFVPVASCLQATPGLQRAKEVIETWCTEHPESSKTMISVELQESVSKDRNRCGVCARFVVSGRTASFGEAKRVEMIAEMRHGGVHGVGISSATNPRHIVKTGETDSFHEVGDFVFRQSMGSFFQTNHFLLEQLVRLVLPEQPFHRGFDLHCGVGLFTLALGQRCDQVVGCDSSETAIRDARYNAARLARDNIRFHKETALACIGREKPTCQDFVLVDPPRGGLPEQTALALGRARPARLHYISCDAPSFARDARLFLASRMVLRRLVLVDMFPNTHHFETLAEFTSDRADR